MISIAGPCPARHDSSLVSDHLSSSQLPVWTIYAEKICVPTTSDLECQASWAFEMVSQDQRERWLQLEVPRQYQDILQCYGINTKIATLGQNVSKLFSFLFRLRADWSESLRDIAGPQLPARPPGGHGEGHHGCCEGPGRVQNKVQGRTKICLQVKYFCKVNLNTRQTNINNIYEHNFLKAPNLQSHSSPVGLDSR